MSAPNSNLLLAALPREVYQALLPALSPLALNFADVLYQPGEPMKEVYFPCSGMVSLLVLVDQHQALEIALVGREAMVGVPLALGARVSPVRALVQGAGEALRMSKTAFLAALERHPPLREAINGNAHLMLRQIAKTAACNRFHQLEARLARWLLMTRDRAGASEFRMTQEFLSAMLGVRRVGVSKAASSFQRGKLIEYSRGNIRVLDHAGLEAACCSCYQPGAAGSEGIAPWRPAAASRSRARRTP